ncbi:MAG TPA: TerC/Alx family metal homeostasis membrane protein [Candidatus Polarisedimenticolaceae bacterium]|nr:TerC/Alx family metal homeostasis membrane protein [Candidatus Polarisedimenticolaceae bacterium]
MLGEHGVAPWIWVNVLLAVCLAVDFGLASGKHRAIGIREAVFWNVFWIALALAFTGVVAYAYGRTPAAEYLTGYVVERALSVDNIFVFVVIFRYFAVGPERQARVLFWGILGALAMRGAFILAGAALVNRFHALLYFFGAFLIYTGIMLVRKGGEGPPEPERNVVVRLVGRVLPLDRDATGDVFFVKTHGRWHATPLFIVLLVVATTDFVFALDSLPAILGITQDPWILYTSNAFAILGMRVLYFLLAAVLPRFRFLNHGLALILVIIGARMLLERWVHVSTEVTLLLVLGILAAAIVASLAIPPKGEKPG